MRRLAPFLLALAASTGLAAEVTRVASSFEDKDPFGMYLDFTFDRVQEKGRITREWYLNGELQDVPELSYVNYRTSMNLDLHLGIFRDLELHVGVPVIFQDDREWGTANGSTHTIDTNCPDARGAPCAEAGNGTGRLFDVPAASWRSGLGDFTFGIAWAPLVQARDPSKPTWVLRFDWTAPTSIRLDPTQTTSSTNRGPVGERIHKYTFSTALSKRLSIAEPWFELHYTLPWRGPGFYSNCDNPSDERLGRAENCGLDGWSREQTGVRPRHTGGFAFGTELNVLDRPETRQRVAFDLRAWANWFSEGRVQSELSDVLGKLLTSSDYAQVGGQLGFVGQAAEFIILKASASLAYDTEHFLTNEAFGKDLDGGGIAAGSAEQNPNYDARIDRVGRRFRIVEQFVFGVQVTATFNF